MFIDYTARVLEEYHKKRDSNSLSSRLARPTTARLREECEAVFAKGLLRKDEKALKDFFELTGDANTYLQSIRRFEADKFRPLVNFLIGRTKGTEDKNIELLAWLIDFELRPYELGRKYHEEKENINNNESSEKPDGKKEGSKSFGNGMIVELSSKEHTQQSKKNSRKKILVITVIGAMILGLAGYILWVSNINSKRNFTGHEACMYWTGDQYKQISCNQKMGETILVALDSERLLNFKRITRLDTITQNSIGRVWYFKKNGKIEYYTAGGNHPIYVQEGLKPITTYIINQHLSGKDQ